MTKLPDGVAWLHDTATQAVCAALGSAVFFVGGCVRDALLGKEGSDVDLATPLRPEEVTERAEAAGFRVVPTGIDHGTVTVVADGRGFEITTFRRDVATDGRRAVVAFSEDISEDARRRDFTLNALYAAPDGRVLDPLGTGVADCLARRIRFIEDANTRIREDYLRILRFFRFHATYARPEEGFDADALDAVARNLGGLRSLPAERIGAEMRKLLAAPDPAPAVAAMRQAGVLVPVLPGSDDRFLGAVVAIAAGLGLPPDPMLRLAALGGDDPATRLRLSREETRRIEALSAGAGSAQPLSEIAYRQGLVVAQGVAVLRAAMSAIPPDPGLLTALESAARARFPVRAQDLMPRLAGKALGAELARLESLWIASGFTLSRDDLLAAH